MKRIFHQKKRGYDSAVRTQALKIIMETGPSDEEILAIVEETTDPDNTEMDMYTQARLFLAADLDDSIK